MSAIGIDFGSSFSTVSWINPNSGKTEIVKFNGDGSVKLPSMVFASDEGFQYGFQTASYFDEISMLPVQQRMEFLPNFIPSLKRILVPGGIEFFYGKQYSHLEILRNFLEHVIEQTKYHCGTQYTIDKVTISHPVDFPSSKIQMLKDALASIGNFNIDTQYEPISAVYGYNLGHKIEDETGILVFDFGGGTIDVSYVQKRNGNLMVVTEPKGNSGCGGQDIDFALYENLRKILKSEMKIDITQSGVVDQVILSACRRLKEKFSGNLDAYETMILLQVDGQICNYRYKLNRKAFNCIIMPVVSTAIGVADIVIADIIRRRLPIDKVLLIGGSSQLTIIRELLQNKIGPQATIETCGEKDIVVALGNIACAIPDDVPIESEPDGNLGKSPDDYPYPSEDSLDYERAIRCKNPQCGSERCYHFANKRGYHCVDCGWEGANVTVVYKY